MATLDFQNPLAWIEKLTSSDLKNWLRLVLWLRDPAPLSVASASRLSISISELLKAGSVELKTRIRLVIPTLLQEWGRDDPSVTLDDLLIICGRLRCAAAEPVILQIANERLRGRAEEISLRQRCLSVLSGFGCTERSEYLFKRYFDDIEYTAICYRALYRYHASYAAEGLSDVYKIFGSANEHNELSVVLHTLFHDFSNTKQRIDLIERFINTSEPENFVMILQAMKGIQALTLELLLECKKAQRADILRSLLIRSPLQDIRDIVWMLRSIGLEIHCSVLSNNIDFVECFYEHPKTNEGTSEILFSTDELSDEIVIALLECSEVVANAWIATMPEEWPVN
jgi:hypothetical protein